MLQSTGVKLLVIEGDEPFRRRVAERLRMEGYRVFEACQEAEALRIVQRKDLDVVLLGLRLLKQRGIALLKTIKEIRPLTEVILVIPSGDLSLSIEGMKLGAFDDVMVPFDMEKLMECVRAACRKRNEKVSARGAQAPA